MDAEDTVRRLIYDHTIKLNHRVPLVRYIDHEQCEPFEPHLFSSPATRGRRRGGGCNGMKPLERLERRSLVITLCPLRTARRLPRRVATNPVRTHTDRWPPNAARLGSSP